MFSYVLQIIAFQLLFLLGYELLLKKETFFTYNRWYLLSTSILALLLPLIQIESLADLVPEEAISNLRAVWLPEVFIGEEQQFSEVLPAVEISARSNALDLWQILYFSGVIGSLFLVFRKFQNLNRLFRFRIISEEKEFKIIEVPASDIACTFFKTIFLGEKLSEEERIQILNHELVHVRQKHSLDLIIFEILKVIFWFNPLIYIYQNKIAAVHEFIADEAVVKRTGKQNYYEQLLNSAFSTRNISFINQFFNHSLIKKRIVMLQKTKSKSISKFKYLVILPLMLVMLTVAGFSKDSNREIYDFSNNENDNEKTELATIQELPIPFAVVEEVPVFPICAKLKKNELRRNCLAENISDYVNKNFNINAVLPHMKVGDNRIVVQFEINKLGEISGVRSRMVSPGVALEAKAFIEKEANRVVASLPKMKPGKHEGKEVAVMYALPIVLFKADSE